jgi:hypothetical protein
MSAPSLSTRDAVTVLRHRYPDGLVCVQCAGLLATRPESYAKSSLSEAARLTYVCCECRLEQAEAARIQEARAQKARHAAQASVAARRLRALEARDVDTNPLPVGLPNPGAEPFSMPAVYAGFHDGFLSTRKPKAPSPRRGGRPRKHATGRAAKTAAQRAWRARRRKQPGVSEALANDKVLLWREETMGAHSEQRR